MGLRGGKAKDLTHNWYPILEDPWNGQLQVPESSGKPGKFETELILHESIDR
jgi:hypothetical protein